MFDSKAVEPGVRTSRPQLVVFGAGMLAERLGYLGFPLWFFVPGKHPGASVG